MNKSISLLRCLVSLGLLLFAFPTSPPLCKHSVRADAPEVFFINMDKSPSRRVSMEQHLTQVGLRFTRIRGLTPKEIYIPLDVQRTWQTRWCLMQTEETLPLLGSVSTNTSSPYFGYSSVMTAMCGRGKKKNSPKELGCTTSHLLAMREAVYSNTGKLNNRSSTTYPPTHLLSFF